MIAEADVVVDVVHQEVAVERPEEDEGVEPKAAQRPLLYVHCLHAI